MNLLIVLTIILSTCAVFEFKPQTLADEDNTPLVKVLVFYTPFSQKAIDFIKLNTKGQKEGIWDIMAPKDGTIDEIKYRIEVDYIPWGRNTRTLDANGALKYDCSAESDTDCLGERLHACIAHNNGVLHHNHHEFFMILCTAQKDDWKTNPLSNIATCAKDVNDEVDDGFGLNECAAKDSADGNRYIDEAISATNVISIFEDITNADNDPLIYINGKRNDAARTDLRTQVCRAFPSDQRPAEECKDVSDTTGSTGSTGSTQQSTTDGDAMVIANTLVLVLVAIIGVVITGMQ